MTAILLVDKEYDSSYNLKILFNLKLRERSTLNNDFSQIIYFETTLLMFKLLHPSRNRNASFHEKNIFIVNFW